jgi:peptidyl-prolyl cis-trans isomerase SurA
MVQACPVRSLRRAARGRLAWVPAFLAAGVCLSLGRPARATIVERVVAVIGEHAVWLSDLRARARPFLAKIYDEVPPGAERAAAISQMYKVLLQRMVDEQLEQRAADRAHIVVTEQEIDDALVKIAAQNNLTVPKLVQAAMSTGMTEQQYRREVRRQVLEAKLLNLRVQGRIRITEQDLRQAYRRIVVNDRKKRLFRGAWIEIHAPRTSPRARLDAKRALANRIAQLARQGVDFGELAQRYSDDKKTSQTGGLLARMKPDQLPPEVGRAALGLAVGEVSAPVRAGDDLVVIKVLERDPSDLPSFDEARAELSERVYLEKMNEAREHWLAGLRKQTHVETRL